MKTLSTLPAEMLAELNLSESNLSPLTANANAVTKKFDFASTNLLFTEITVDNRLAVSGLAELCPLLWMERGSRPHGMPNNFFKILTR